jgi:hypothetical protein
MVEGASATFEIRALLENNLVSRVRETSRSQPEAAHPPLESRVMGLLGEPDLCQDRPYVQDCRTRDIQVSYGTGGCSVDKFCTQPLFCKERRSSDTIASETSCETT